MTRYPIHDIPDDRVDDYRYLSQKRGWNGAMARDHILAGLPIPRVHPDMSKGVTVATSATVVAVARALRLDPAQITGKERFSELVTARAIVTEIMRRHGLSYPQIGKRLGGRDHSTMVHCHAIWRDRLSLDPRVKALTESIYKGVPVEPVVRPMGQAKRARGEPRKLIVVPDIGPERDADGAGTTVPWGKLSDCEFDADERDMRRDFVLGSRRLLQAICGARLAA